MTTVVLRGTMRRHVVLMHPLARSRGALTLRGRRPVVDVVPLLTGNGAVPTSSPGGLVATPTLEPLVLAGAPPRLGPTTTTTLVRVLDMATALPAVLAGRTPTRSGRLSAFTFMTSPVMALSMVANCSVPAFS